MNRPAVFHEPRGALAHPAGPSQLRVVLRVARDDLEAVTVVYGDRYAGGEQERLARMARGGRDALHDYWVATLTLPERRFRYTFLLDDGQERLWYGAGGFRAERPPAWETEGFFHYPYLFPGDAWEPPAWAQGAVFYQVFPDRFANGDPGNDPPGVQPWGAPVAADSFFGGDLRGILDHLDHLSGLGATGLYLTPIFLAPSNHKYDTADYYRIDPHLGDPALVRQLVEECHARGIRVVLDGVFNHCGFFFAPFQDVLEKGEESPYAGWFNVERFPVRTGPRPGYETFGHGHASLPKLRTDNPAVREYLIGAAEHWTRTLEIDGWRLDVAGEVHREFWREFRRRIKALRPDALLIGEVGHEAPAWLEGDQFDCVMNYPFRDACVDFFARRAIGAPAFAARLTRLRFRYPEPVNRAQLNLLGSHDTERFLTLCGGDRRRLRLAALFQFTCPGAPYIYYGDEVGLEGWGDPDCRRCMVWEEGEQDRELYGLFRRLARLRRDHPVLSRGDFAFLLADPLTDVLAYLRWDGQEQALVLLNNGLGEAEVPWAELQSRAADAGVALARPTAGRAGLRLPPLDATLYLTSGE